MYISRATKFWGAIYLQITANTVDLVKFLCFVRIFDTYCFVISEFIDS